MDFPQAGIESAKKFLDYFLSRQQKSSPNEGENAALLVAPNLATVSREEAEAESLDMARTLLAKSSCPGMLAYHIAAAAVGHVMAGPVDTCSAVSKVEQPDEQQEKEKEDAKEPAIQLLDAKLLAKVVAEAVLKVCGEWQTSLPTLTCPKLRRELSIYAAKNTRRKMEDRHSICVDINSLYNIKDIHDQSYYAVFDGHIGMEAANYSSVHLHHNLVHHPAFYSDPELAMKEAVRTTDRRFCEKEWKSGCTALFSLFRGPELYVGWVGDSQAKLVQKGGKVVNLVQPHKPDREDETERIQEAGGMVLWMGAWRVNGNLSVSRAIGDAKDKKFVIGEADVKRVELTGSEEYLVLACDGVWDTVNEEELVECVKKHFTEGGLKRDTAKAICNYAIEEGSGDNVTAIVVFLEGFEMPQQ